MPQEDLRKLDWHKLIWENFFVRSMAIGISHNTFLHLNPRKLQLCEEGIEIRRKQQDAEMWTIGIYVQRAVSVAVEHCLYGRKARSEYFKEPIRLKGRTNAQNTEQELTEEQKKLARDQLLMQLKIMMSNFNTSKKS